MNLFLGIFVPIPIFNELSIANKFDVVTIFNTLDVPEVKPIQDTMVQETLPLTEQEQPISEEKYSEKIYETPQDHTATDKKIKTNKSKK